MSADQLHEIATKVDELVVLKNGVEVARYLNGQRVETDPFTNDYKTSKSQKKSIFKNRMVIAALGFSVLMIFGIIGSNQDREIQTTTPNKSNINDNNDRHSTAAESVKFNRDICMALIEQVERFDGKPHDLEECVKDAGLYRKFITEINLKISKEIVRKKSGFHCLSSWDGSHSGVKNLVKKNMRDPDSWEHIETRIASVDNNGKHTLYMKYRAKNGFGGINIAQAIATVDSNTCNATVISMQ